MSTTKGQQLWEEDTNIIPICQVGKLRPRDVEMKCLRPLSERLKQVAKSVLRELQAWCQARFSKALTDAFSHRQKVSDERTTPNLCFLPFYR